MKNPHILTLFLIGAVITVIGALFKITHERQEITSLFLIIGMTFEAIAAILLIIKLFKKKNKSDTFFDS